jgi:RNA polymerase sigma-70 factor (ECF subfamily)
MNTAVLITDRMFAPKSGAVGGWPLRTFSPTPAAWQDGATSARVARVFPSQAAGRMTSATPADASDFAALVEAVAARQDRAAFTRVFAYYAPRVKAYLIRLGLDGAQAEEVTQEVMVAVWRKAASFDSAQASVSTWIFRIARNRRIDVFRRDRRETLDAKDPAFEPPAEVRPDGAAEAAEREAQVRRAMDDLPPEQRDLVRRAFYEDLSHSEIAASTGVPLGTVKSRLRLAFAKLKLTLADTAEGAEALT